MSYITESLDPITMFHRVLARTRRKTKAKEKVNAFVSPIVGKRVVMCRGRANNFLIR